MANSRPLDCAQLGALATATLDNAEALIRDGQGLLTVGRWPIAHSVSTLAAEEFGKHLMCFGAVGKAPTDATYWTEFWKRFRTHKPKYENYLGLAVSMLEPEIQDQVRAVFDDIVRTDQRRRLSGLYVGFDDRGVVVHPDDAVELEDAEVAVDAVANVIISWSGYWQGIDFSVLFEGNKLDATRVQEMLKNRDDEALKAEFNRLHDLADGNSADGGERDTDR